MPTNGTSVEKGINAQAAEVNNLPLEAARAEITRHRAILAQEIQSLPLAERKELLVQQAGALPTKERTEVVREVKGFEPSPRVRDRLWTIVIMAFAIVLVGAFATLAISVFLAPVANGTSGQVILTVFTTVVGFLAGLFTTNPMADAPANPG
jgi:hypothetical protein